ncbi:hypothetical protein A5753_07155 [Mycobacterium sp. 852002-51971_SCH5477799-a]|uniref:DUF4258 domain-containing protein n=1 Tax=Mycobacterium sp. 852002-51971_SCH5477799-a TaxID=1834106 RepID=UPI0007FEEBB9|nr:DUF4258 domain-containing protein [Mycobacterium sp. 852002-51971_SCH5477799-a]OBF66470.1 hypothetical protein A5753_07155 [Mycobacterium sp. 852002-51971_SCH5477799-a]
MRITDSARKHYAEHNLTDDDVWHVLRNFIRRWPQTGQYDGRLLLIGPDTTGRLLEIVVVPIADPDRIIHVNLLQPKLWNLL